MIARHHVQASGLWARAIVCNKRAAVSAASPVQTNIGVA
jgi:hypothetical protein